MGVCLLVWCVGQVLASPQSLVFAHDILTSEDNVFAYERPWLVAGFVQQVDAQNAVFAGVVPLKIDLFNQFLSLEGGALIASVPVPPKDTRGKFMAGARLRLSDRIALMYWHWSNGALGGLHLSVNAVGVSVRLRE
jgi:hypothetical protein